MREEVGYSVKDVSDHTHKELQPKEVLKVFNEKYVNICDPIELLEVHFKQEHGGIFNRNYPEQIWCTQSIPRKRKWSS